MLTCAGYAVTEADDVIHAAPLLRKSHFDVLVLGQMIPVRHKRVIAAAALVMGIYVVNICEDCEIERDLVRANAYLDPLAPIRLLHLLNEQSFGRRMVA